MSGYHLFDVFGVEMEYMIVDAESLDVKPITDELLRDVAGEITSEVELGELAWSNELALHVVEIKTNGPAKSLDDLAVSFQESVARINELLRPRGARLMPTAMHPWMNPDSEMKLWPHEYNAIYEAYDRIFSCKGHGWANLQSTHLNLPFSGDEEFGRLHAAIRLVLPILPALAASSPIMEGRNTGLLDTRLETYRHNADRIPSIAGHVIPEAVFTREDYDREIFRRIFADIAPHDPDNLLRDEFLNSRGAIARFGRGSIEIRVLDIQECPRADIAILSFIEQTLRALVDERWATFEKQCSWSETELQRIFLATISDGGQAEIEDPRYLDMFGFPSNLPATARELWNHLDQTLYGTLTEGDPLAEARHLILDKGTLARRILADLGGDPTRENLARTYGKLCDCLAEGRLFR